MDFKCLFLLICVKGICCWRVFHNGRMVGGNLGVPHGHEYRTKVYDDESENWFIQNLDHFDPVNQDTWKQRYFVNDEFFDKKARDVAFLMIGGEGVASPEWMTKGAWIDYAKKFKAICFQLEHRYYGKSQPKNDLSTENLQYLTSQQSLADSATFIEAMNQQYELSPSVKWIAFGGSYPGSLAAWLRQKYPHLVHGAMSASGPLIAELDFQDYFKVINDDLRSISSDCLTAVKQGTAQVDILLKHMVGQRNLDKLFNLCDPIEKNIGNKLDISNFFQTLAGNFAMVAQYNKDNRMGKSKRRVTLDDLCDILTNQTLGAPVKRLAVINDLLLDTTNQTCLDYKYDKMILELKNESLESETSEGGRQWVYQTCTEFGFFQTSTYKPQVFSDKFPVDFFIQQCIDIFGPQYNASFLNRAIERTNILYGALDIEVTNVVFVHGSVDPWHALGITKTVNQGAPAIYIKGTAHCANMYPPSDKDLPQLKAARVEIQQLIGSWLDL